MTNKGSGGITQLGFQQREEVGKGPVRKVSKKLSQDLKEELETENVNLESSVFSQT